MGFKSFVRHHIQFFPPSLNFAQHPNFFWKPGCKMGYCGNVSKGPVCRRLGVIKHSESNNKRSHLKGHVIFAHPLKLIITIIPQ